MARARSLVILLALASLASGSSKVVNAQTPAIDTAARRVRVDASMLQPGQFVYQTTLERDAGTSVLGTRTVSVSQSPYIGTPAWLILETRFGDGIPATDSLFTTTTDLRPLHWSSFLGDARLIAEFRGDSAFGGTTSPAGRRSMLAPVPGGTLLNAAMAETILRLVPLQAAWEDSTLSLSISLNGNVLLPTRMSVIGEDRIRVPAGLFDCWVVAIHAGDQARGLYWVTKREPIVVRSSIDVPAMGRGADGGGSQMISALIRIAR